LNLCLNKYVCELNRFLQLTLNENAKLINIIYLIIQILYFERTAIAVL